MLDIAQCRKAQTQSE